RDGRLQKQTLARGEQMEQGLAALAASRPAAVSEVRGRGLAWGVEFADPSRAAAVCARAFELGLLLETSGPRDEVVKLFPPLTIDEQELEEGLALFASAVRETERPARPAGPR
ncbi:aminotransferase class III-fold pyridoxal phosphate-dependent enzyme, partial [Streptomyces tunisiensis]|uniref:aminotransferase class III-fold pyridoxal phosphate-dependent enzyme n=1 Tax=Streptomyces tunisiensis TaxID=948699 RepID=UPI00403DFA3D